MSKNISGVKGSLAETMDVDDVQERCLDLEQAAQAAISWVGDNPARIGAEEDSLRRSFRRHKREATRLAKASVRPLSIGVFGPSQTGKSYLMTTLAGRDAKLSVRLGSKDYDFLTDINPGGDGEATGVVTRFGTKTSEGRSEAPVVLRMLSRNDLLKIFSTAFILNTRLDESSNLTADAVATHLQSFPDSDTDRPRNDDFELDVAELRDYVTSRCSDKAIISALNSARFWERASEIGQGLDSTDRTRLFSILWGEHVLLTEVFSELDGILEQLSGAEIVYAQIDALIPRESGVQDVETVKRLGCSDEPLLRIQSQEGISIDVPRASLAALTAELQLKLENGSHAFLRHTDLLDFPGLRPPVEIEDPNHSILRGGSSALDSSNRSNKKENNDRASVGTIILRGKVDYLFRRFCEDYEINALLLLLKPGNQDIQALPKIVRHWVDITHGDTPRRREARITSLFVVLSWFDEMFGRKAGDKDPARRFEVRVDGVMNFFKQAGDWPQTWAVGEAFRNVFWLRNPKVYQPGLIEYDGEWKGGNVPREKQLQPAVMAWKDSLRSAHRSLIPIRRHFDNPDEAFDAGLKLNDGGAQYIADKLAPVCTSQHKLIQISEQEQRHRKELCDTLERFYVSGDRVKQIKARMDAAAEFRLELQACQIRNRFASMQRLLQITPDEMLGLYQHVVTRRSTDDESVPTAASRERDAAVGHSTPDQRFARSAIAFWLATSRERLNGVGARKLFRLTEEGVTTLLDELAAAARRENLEQQLCATLREIMGFRYVSADRIALAAADRVSRFVENLTLDPSRRVRISIMSQTGTLDLPTNPSDYWSEVDNAWIEAFMNMVRLNAEAQIGGETVDPEQNKRLGTLLESLGSDAVRTIEKEPELQ